MTIAAIISMNSPTTSRNPLSSASSRIGFDASPPSAAATFCGTCSTVSVQLNGAAAAMMIATATVSRSESRSATSVAPPVNAR